MRDADGRAIQNCVGLSVEQIMAGASPKTAFDLFGEEAEKEAERRRHIEAERRRYIAEIRSYDEKRRAEKAAAKKAAEEALASENTTRVKFAVPPVSSYNCPRASTSSAGAAGANVSRSLAAAAGPRSVGSRAPPPLPQRPAVHKQVQYDEPCKLPPPMQLLGPNFFSTLKGSRIDIFESPGLTRSVSITLPTVDMDFEEAEELYNNLRKGATLQRTPSKMKKALTTSTPNGLDKASWLRSGTKR